MRYLITGGAGFIGSHLIRLLQDHRHQISVIDDLSTGHMRNLPDDVIFYKGDCGDLPLLGPLIAEADGVFHLAAIASVPRSREAWSATSDVNQAAFVRLLETVHRDGRHLPVVYASSAAIYGDPPTALMPLDEQAPLAPLTPYGADKAGCELHAYAARYSFKLPTMGLRFFNVYGERQDPSSPYSGVISIFAERISQQQPITIFGDGLQTRDFIYGGDVAAALYSAMERLQAGDWPKEAALNICRGEEITIAGLAALLGQLCNRAPAIHYEAARNGDILRSVGNSARAKEFLRWQPHIALKEGLRRTLEWMQESAT